MVRLSSSGAAAPSSRRTGSRTSGLLRVWIRVGISTLVRLRARLSTTPPAREGSNPSPLPLELIGSLINRRKSPEYTGAVKRFTRVELKLILATRPATTSTSRWRRLRVRHTSFRLGPSLASVGAIGAAFTLE